MRPLRALALIFIILVATPAGALAASAEAIDRDVSAALARLYANVKGARELGQRATAILLFPTIGKAGALRRGGRSVGYFKTSGGKTGYALFFMSDKAARRVEKSEGGAVASLPGLHVVRRKDGALKGEAGRNAVYALAFDQLGRLSEASLGGQKYSRTRPGG